MGRNRFRWCLSLPKLNFQLMTLLGTVSRYKTRPVGSFQMVGPVRFELTTPCTPCKCATSLRYGPDLGKGAKATDLATRGKTFLRIFSATPPGSVSSGKSGGLRPPLCFVSRLRNARMAELADALDSKSCSRKGVWVRPPLWAPSLL